MDKNPETKNSLKTLKFRNRRVVLAFMRLSGAVSVNDISSATGLSKMTVHKIIDYYLQGGMISTAGKGESTDEGGKKPNLFIFNPNFRFVFAIRLTGRSLVASLVNLKGERLLDSIRFDLTNLVYADVVRLMGEAFVTLLAGSGMKATDCVSAVVGCDGIVNVMSGVCRAIYSADWDMNMPLRESLASVLPAGLFIYVDNWWRHVAHGEVCLRGSERRDHFYLLGNFGDNVSGGLVVDGVISHGATGLAGEIGHMIVAAGASERCVCGGKGCLEAMVAPGHLLAKALARREVYPSSLIWHHLETGAVPGAAIALAAVDGDVLARELLEEAVEHFAVAINNIVCACDPGTVIIFGDYALAKDWFLDKLREKLSSVTMRGIDKCTDIRLAVGDTDAGLIGAAKFVTDSLFANEG